MDTKILILFVSLVLLSVPSYAGSLPYVVGGEDVDSPTRWPWQCSLRSSGNHVCGASIISATWLVTAAHCVGGSSLSVRCGSIYRTSGGEIQYVQQVIKHEDYGEGDGAFPNDIAVLKVNALTLNDRVKAIPLATTDTAGNNDCHITGWGDTGEYGLPYILQQAKVDVYTQTYCKAEWGPSLINDGHVCVGDTINHIGCCNGDSGGPLVCRVGGVYQLVGATSFTDSGCTTEVPSVYSRVSYFREWIRQKTGV